MSTESSNEVNQFVANLAASDRLASNSAQREAYSDANLPSVLVDFTKDNVVQSSSGLASIKDTFSPPPPPAPPKETTQWLPKVTVTSSKTSDAAYETLRRQAETILAENLKEELTSILMADLNSGPAGLEDFDLGLFNAINEYRASKGLSQLEYDPDLRDRAIANNDQQRSHRKIGHYVGGTEVAGWNYGTPENTLQGWIDSPPHRRILNMPGLTHMGPSGDPTWQSVQFS